MNVVQTLIRDLQLWLPQREGLEVLDRILRVSPLGRGITKKQTIWPMLGAEPPVSYAVQQGLFSFEEEVNPKSGTEFPSFCFAIATGGGKTRLMGACIAYLYYTKGFKNFFVLSKGETIYNKHRLEDFDPASPKYVFKGLSDFPSPRLIHGDNYERSSYPELFSDDLSLYLFNIEKIFNERTDVEFRFHKFQETIGKSFADVLRAKQDLVMLMDESHNIRAEKSLRAINALQPILGLEFTATPKAHNVVYAFPLRRATSEGGPNGGGLVKRARVITRRDDDSLVEEKEDIKLRDGILIHENKKAALIAYCENNNLPVVKPRVLVCAPPSQKDQEQKHIERIAEYLQSQAFLNGAYKGKVLAVHQGSDDEQIQRLLDLEKKDNDIEIVLHVNKLKEGWDVKTIYTIVPLRASVSEILTVQTIGRGLRLPFGRQVSRDPGLSEAERQELLEIDTLEIVSHEKYSAVLDKVKAEPDWDVMVAPVPEGKLEPREIVPDGPKEHQLNIPVIESKFHTKAEIDLSGIKPNFERLQDLEVKLVGTDLGSLEERDYVHILEECQGSLVNFFVRILIEETDEFDIRDKERLQRFVKAYLDKAQVDSGERKEVLFKHRGKIARDLLDHIRKRTDEKTEIKYVATKKRVEFRPHRRMVKKGYKEKDKNAALDRDSVQVPIGGYAKTIFSRNVFDSKPEKWLGDVLDRDKEVIRWVRPPTGQMPIAHKGGNYNPDFVVECKGGLFFLVEVKAGDDLSDLDVLAKARAGKGWCLAMSKATGKSWEYKLIPDTAVNPSASFKGIISNAVEIT